MPEAKQASMPDPTTHPSFMFAMGELSGNVAALRNEVAAFREDRAREVEEMREERDKDRDRIGSLEKWRMWTLGFAAALTILVNLFIQWFGHHV